MTYGKSNECQILELASKFEEVQLIYRNRTPAADRPSVKSPDAAYQIFLKSWNIDQIGLIEECKVLLLDRSLKMMSIANVSKGGISGTVVDPKIVFSIALKRGASSIILAHNHPSGNIKPSEQDLTLTKNFIRAGKALQIPLLDHLIITLDHYTSLSNDGFMDLDYS